MNINYIYPTAISHYASDFFFLMPFKVTFIFPCPSEIYTASFKGH